MELAKVTKLKRQAFTVESIKQIMLTSLFHSSLDTLLLPLASWQLWSIFDTAAAVTLKASSDIYGGNMQQTWQKNATFRDFCFCFFTLKLTTLYLLLRFAKIFLFCFFYYSWYNLLIFNKMIPSDILIVIMCNFYCHFLGHRFGRNSSEIHLQVVGGNNGME